jgi:hypothetical protein
MDSGMISKIQKSKRYAQEPGRVKFRSFHVIFEGEHGTYNVIYEDGEWSCQCEFFHQRGVCSHTMTMERLLGVMLDTMEEEDISVQEA